ncbi:ABC transporter substrate-binding protein [Marinobacter antarcticus]|uniref:Carbohydrate ABC transporter substrate-binding protein n=2 Tax=root TaxID=1 RepID=A0A831R6I2_9GAMM|nr:ABC transporter substrate-binding protein [Marinobacter antarcticus]HEA53079.1 carbohydrate ABC transporter substrate-binding protein [Marinobacter antarcticus]
MKLSVLLTALTYTLCVSSSALGGPLFDALSPEKQTLIKTLIDDQFARSTLSANEQAEELAWFVKAAAPLSGTSISVLSEELATHFYESATLAPAFSRLTGVPVTHDLKPEGDVIRQVNLQRIMAAKGRYDAFVNDSDLIGTHSRSGWALALSDYMEGAGKPFTLPSLALDDFIGLDFVTGPDGKLYQLPDQQFANLYWFRYDWFQRPELRAQFRQRYGYELGVPVNWSAYEDIAEFFSVYVKEIDGERVYGHMDYGKRDPSLGWRFTDAWLSMAGAGDKGSPNGLPVDEWGVRMEDCHPVGSSMSRGGATNSPASVYALNKYIDWLKRFAPPKAANLTFTGAGPVPAKGHIAQQIFWYTAFTSDMTKAGLPVVNEDGTPKWRMAPSPHGAYWENGMKLGYQDVGAWTIPRVMGADAQKASWLYAQFTVSRTVSLEKTLYGLTPIRLSDLKSPEMQARAPELGGLVEFYLSPARQAWSPTGLNIPDYPRLAKLWWPNIADAVDGKVSAQVAMDNLADAQDRALSVVQRNYLTTNCGPVIAPKSETKGAKWWLAQPGAPKPKLTNEKPQGETIRYEDLIRSWDEAGR